MITDQHPDDDDLLLLAMQQSGVPEQQPIADEPSQIPEEPEIEVEVAEQSSDDDESDDEGVSFLSILL